MQHNPFKQIPSKKGAQFRNSGFGRKRNLSSSLSKKEKEWGKEKFTPVPQSQPATPWATFKNEILQKQQEINAGSSVNMETEEARQFLKQREMNYRRMLITETQKEPTKWEDFSEDVTVAETQSKNYRNKNQGHYSQKFQQNIFSKKKSNLPLVDDSLLKNFDSKKLNFKQNNTLRKAITKTTHLARGATLKSVVEDMQRRGFKRSSIGDKTSNSS